MKDDSAVVAVPADSLSVTFGRDGGTVVVGLMGELDCATVPVLRDAFASLVEEQGNMALRVDLSGMTFIDSSGLNLLVSLLRRLREKGGELTLASPNGSALRLFEMVGFTQMFRITPSPSPAARR